MPMTERTTHIVVVERDDNGPLVVGFDGPRQAEAWVVAMNNLMTFTFPCSYHMYSREPAKPMSPEDATTLMIEDAVIQLKEDHDG